MLEQSDGEPVALLAHDRAAAYLVPAELYERMLDAFDVIALAKLVRQRQEQARIRVSLDEL